MLNKKKIFFHIFQILIIFLKNTRKNSASPKKALFWFFAHLNPWLYFRPTSMVEGGPANQIRPFWARLEPSWSSYTHFKKISENQNHPFYPKKKTCTFGLFWFFNPSKPLTKIWNHYHMISQSCELNPTILSSIRGFLGSENAFWIILA